MKHTFQSGDIFEFSTKDYHFIVKVESIDISSEELEITYRNTTTGLTGNEQGGFKTLALWEESLDFHLYNDEEKMQYIMEQ
jgi:hypothetical protein